MKVIDFIYQGQNVQFSDNGNLMVNATQMANIFGAKVNGFLRNKKTIEFIQACLRNPRYKSKDELVYVKKNNGTWMHKTLALHFAMWLDADFALWVSESIDMMILEKLADYEKYQKSTLKIVEAEEKIKALEKIRSNTAEANIIKELKKTISQEKKKIEEAKKSFVQLELFSE